MKELRSVRNVFIHVLILLVVSNWFVPLVSNCKC